MTTSSITDRTWRADARAVLECYALNVANLEHVAQGLINLTVKVTTDKGERYILQRLNPVFSDSVNENLEQVTTHLGKRGLVTPTLVRTSAKTVSVHRDPFIWRLLTYVDGRAVDSASSPGQTRAAGALLAKFHCALLDFDGTLKPGRAPVHDLDRHLEHLRAALVDGRGHRLYAEVSALAQELTAALRLVPDFVLGEPRLVHGDPKISNILFAADADEGVCLIDLDTVASMPLAYELGDAMRSWCNPYREDALEATFDLGLFEHAIAGYCGVAHQFLTDDELASIVPATLQIHLELAARFLADALEERYFGWDRARYASSGEHNVARARGQLTASRSLACQLNAAQSIVAASSNFGS